MRTSFYLLSVIFMFFMWSCATSSDEPAPNNTTNNNDDDNNVEILGCTDPNSSSYNSAANVDDGSCVYGIESGVDHNPRNYTAKILIEQMTGTWCGWCVDGALRMKSLIEDNDGKVIGATIHQGDPMFNSSVYNYIRGTFGTISFPSGLVNRRPSISSGDRVMSRGEWATNANALLDDNVNMGIALDVKLEGNDLTVLAHVGVDRAEENNYSLVIYLLEDGLVYAQENYYSSAYGSSGGGDPNHPYWTQPAVINNYVHNHVVRRSITPMSGVEVPEYAKAAGGMLTRVYNVDVSTYNKSNLKVVAFVENRNTNNVINAQMVNVPADGETVTQDFD